MGQISKTVQCQFCLKHEGLIFCSCGICLRPDEEQAQRIKTGFEVVIVPHYFARVNYSRGKRHGEAQWQKDIGKQEMPTEEQVGTLTKSIESLRKFMDGQKIVGIWTASQRSTSPPAHPWAPAELVRKHPGTKTPSYWYHAGAPRTISQVFNESKDDKTPTS